MKVYGVSGGIGHGRDVDPSSVQQEVVLAIETPLSEGELAVEEHASMVNAMSAECASFRSVVVVEQVRQVEQESWI